MDLVKKIIKIWNKKFKIHFINENSTVFEIKEVTNIKNKLIHDNMLY